MKLVVITIVACTTIGGCAGNNKYEQLAKCSDDENPVPPLALGPRHDNNGASAALAGVVKDDCGPMRPVNQF
ncbi:MAG: hypothetical protein EOS81_03125 [Mesorhizobium sp.]|nr:hypothetical protein EJ071_37460 [Mesorhizobium sp. M1B.F.Ca.ET.045.04.1.1]RWF05855.1 MAG: hypothetical protein EOS81_03125 [Mesorhizobium sp.]TIV73852.1 MAG: hypothetical protein E5V79_04200 [Mesorhizobium sp.]